VIEPKLLKISATSVDTQQWAQPITAGVHGVSSKKYQLEVVE